MSDLIAEIHYACNGDQHSFDYLAGLTAEDWASQPHALGQFLQEPRYEAGWMDRFARLLAAVLEPHGREVLTDYLHPTSVGALTAIEVVEKIGAPRALFAVPLLDVLAASEQVPLYLRNRAAQAAAQLQGRALPPPLERAPLPVTDEGLRRALAPLPDDAALRIEALGAVAACAEALGEPALALLRDFMQERIGAGSRPSELSPLLSRSTIARRALLELLPRPELRPGVCAAIEQAPDPLYEAPLEALLAACPDAKAPCTTRSWARWLRTLAVAGVVEPEGNGARKADRGWAPAAIEAIRDGGGLEPIGPRVLDGRRRWHEPVRA